MREQEKGEGSDGKENMKTRSDESGEEKNGDDDNQKSAQKKKGEKRLSRGLSRCASIATLDFLPALLLAGLCIDKEDCSSSELGINDDIVEESSNLVLL